jgi:hypothetical protein
MDLRCSIRELNALPSVIAVPAVVDTTPSYRPFPLRVFPVVVLTQNEKGVASLSLQLLDFFGRGERI